MKKFNKDTKYKIAIIGLGYVGLPLAVHFSKKYETIGFDKDKNRIKELKDGFDKTLEISNQELNLISNLKFTSDIQELKRCMIYIVTVPTPVDRFKTPDLSYLKNATKLLGKLIKKGNIVIYESTVYPGATEDYCVPILKSISGLVYNKDFFCGYSPERINPGDKVHTITKITKVTSGSTIEAADFVDKLYQTIINKGTFKASSIAVAEAAKVIENTQRDVNIALINEFSIIFNKLGIDTKEILKVASTKWNFIQFSPGLVGGHCIGVDPYYLTHKSIEVGYKPEIILAGRRINDGMGKVIADQAISEMTKANINIINAKVGILGLSFKENCPDIRNTNVISIIDSLIEHKCKVSVSDPKVDFDLAKSLYGISLVDYHDFKNIDCIILAVAHNEFKNIKIEKWKRIFNNKKAALLDVKSLYSEQYFNNSSINYWRL